MKINLSNALFLLRNKLFIFLMRTFIFLFCATSFSLTPNDIVSQNSKIIIEEGKKLTVDEVFDLIMAQTDYIFFYEQGIFEDFPRIKVKKGIVKANELLKRSLSNGDFEITLTNNSDIIIKKKIPDNNIIIDQGFKVSGVVTDQFGQPLPGANILEKNTTNGVQTDFDGNFSLEVANSKAILVVSYLGYKSEEVPVGSQTKINVILQEDISGLDEIVVVGYGTQKKVNLTGSVDVIPGDVLEDRSSPSVSQLLQGTSSGLTFSINNNGFQPGANVGVQIRGIGSINGNGGAPYVLVDGIEGDMNLLNPNDIESISVLKDASASAIYGARAAFGVILITTKSGKKGKMNINFTTSYSVATPQKLPEMLNSYTHARIINEAGRNRGGQYFANRIIDNIIAFQAGDLDHIRAQPNFPQDATHFGTIPLNGGNQWAFQQNANDNVDWWDIMYGTGSVRKNDISVSGGTGTTNYHFSMGHFEQEGVLNFATDTYERYNITAKIKMAIGDNFDITYKPRFSKTERKRPTVGTAGYSRIFHAISRKTPTDPLYDGHGGFYRHPTHAGGDGGEVTEDVTHWQSLSAEFRPVKGLRINADLAYRNTDVYYKDYIKTIFELNVDKTLTAVGNTNPSQLTVEHQSDNYWTANVYTSYDFDIKNKHNFQIMVGTQFEEWKNRSLEASKTNIIVSNVPSLGTADGTLLAEDALGTIGTQGYFGRFTYNFKEKYLLEANVRYDGSSRFSEGNRWGFFPSFSGGWNVDKENFWKGIKNTVNTFKLKGSWGDIGNQNTAPYQDLEIIPLDQGTVNWLYQFGGTRPVGFAGVPSLISPNLTWETVRTLNLVSEMAFFNNKLQTGFEWFQRTTFDMIGPAESRPGILGTDVPEQNNATLRVRGWEAKLNWNHRVSQDFSYKIGLSLFDSKAVVTKYNNPTGILSDWYEGREQGEIWGYTVHDLYRSQEEVDEYTANVDLSDLTGLPWFPGDVRYEDITGDGSVDDGANTFEDHGDLKIIGNSTPHYQYNINLGARYKDFDFSMVWNGVGKKDVFMGNNVNMYWGFRTGNQSSLFAHNLDYYRDQEGDEYTGLFMGGDNINTDAYWPRPYIHNGSNAKNRLANTRYLANGAYLRLQNVQLGYNFPKSVLEKININQIRLYLSGENLLTFSDLPVGIDPVALIGGDGIGKTYGADRIYSVGLKITY